MTKIRKISNNWITETYIGVGLLYTIGIFVIVTFSLYIFSSPSKYISSEKEKNYLVQSHPTRPLFGKIDTLGSYSFWGTVHAQVDDWYLLKSVYFDSFYLKDVYGLLSGYDGKKIFFDGTVSSSWNGYYIIPQKIIQQSGTNLAFNKTIHIPDLYLYIQSNAESIYSVQKISDVQYHISERKNVLDTGNTLVATISPFKCTSAIQFQDCDYLIKTLEDTNAETYISPSGVRFYKLLNDDKWLLINGNHYGYYITTNIKQHFYSFFDGVHFIDRTFLEKNAENNVIDICRNNGFEMKKIDTIKRTIASTDYILYVHGHDMRDIRIVCKLSVAFSPTYHVVLQDMMTLEHYSKSTLKNMTVFDGWRGFEFYFPKKNLYIGSQNFVTDLNIAGVKCDKRLRIVDTSKAYNTTNPDMEVYACDSEMDLSTLSYFTQQQHLLLLSSGDKFFIIKVYNQDFGDVANSLKINSLD